MTTDFSKAPRPAEHSPFPWTVEMGEGDRPYVCDANGTVILKFYRANIDGEIPWRANIAATLPAVNAYGAGQADAAADWAAPYERAVEEYFSGSDVNAHPPAASARIAELTKALIDIFAVTNAAREENALGVIVDIRDKINAALAGGRT